MTFRSDGRRVLSATMQPELYERLYAYCKGLDVPITVFVREAITNALPNLNQPITGKHLTDWAKARANSAAHQDLSSQMIVPVEFEVVASLVKTP